MSEFKSAIYGILNLVNGKIYIGSAVDVYNRLRTHKSRLNLNKHPSKHLQGAWNEYGSFAFEFVILEYCFKEQLIKREEVWFELTDCCNPNCGYNKRKIATSNLGLKLGPASEERKRKLSEIHKGRVISEEQKEKIRQSSLGSKRTKEHIENAIKGRLGYKHSEETKAKMRKARQIVVLRRYNHEGEFSYEI